MKISISWIKGVISVVAISVIFVRVIWPDLKIDAITVGLIIVAILPWIAELIESAKFPGGWEIKFRDVKEAGSKVTAPVSKAEIGTAFDKKKATPSFLAVFETDSNLALVGLRIEIEKRIRDLATKNGLVPSRPLVQLLRDFGEKNLLPSRMINGLEFFVQAGNQAAHGAKVQSGVAEWAQAEGPRILAALDEQLNK